MTKHRICAAFGVALLLAAPSCSDDEVSPLCEAVQETRAAYNDLTDPATLEGGREAVSEAADALSASLVALEEQASAELSEGLATIEEEVAELEQDVADADASDLGSGEVADQIGAVENSWSAMGEEARAAFGDC
jgi:hypothetical protein